jgi:hypothetical protein
MLLPFVMVSVGASFLSPSISIPEKIAFEFNKPAGNGYQRFIIIKQQSISHQISAGSNGTRDALSPLGVRIQQPNHTYHLWYYTTHRVG